ncbi:hypothetical protein H5397_03700 [Propioniciclava sp. MC1683]|uniref:hypothetical protein n=1 Tax=unclassified Propioniciclava TaxID=2642922 RepID=UPI0015FFEC4A|nr:MULTISPECIES: hypothetical protein [unclassified Propioniciclava]MBB1494420.1 hypothetical protein [Propioniciclava sp. MC1595]MBB1500543.1 hypothetical protein [Propioniciclava sp. MC1683]
MSQPWQQDPYQRRPVDINAYAPPKRGGGGWWLALVGIALVGVVLAALFLRPTPPAPSEPAPSPSASEAANAGPGMPFTMPGSTTSHGRWEVLDHSWDVDGVTLRVRVTADGGRVSYGFVAFSNVGTEVYEPLPGAPDPEIGSGVLEAGQYVEGNLYIPLPRGDSTLILTTAQGRQMSALPIPG